MTTYQRKRCPECSFSETIKWGIQHGHQRYKCNNSGSYFTSTKAYRKRLNLMIWFERWVLGEQTIRQLSDQSGSSEKSLRIWFDEYLRNYPEWEISRREKANLMIDGTYFANKVCLVLYRDNRVKATLMYRLTDGEWKQEIMANLQDLLDIRIEIESVTRDGLSNIIKSVKKTSKSIVIQRCIVHVQRECLIWLTKHPKSEAGVELRKIVCLIHTIKEREQWGYWVVSLVRWEEQYRVYLNQKTFKEDTNRYWFTHKMVRRSFVHMRRALPDMFHYLDNPDIPSNTNSLESFFGHLKPQLRSSRFVRNACCFILDFYIKPQRSSSVPFRLPVVLYWISTSNHNYPRFW